MALSASGLMAHAVREAVDSVAAPDRRESVITLALRWSNNSEIPEGPEIADFVENALYRAAEELLGADRATMIVDQLRPIAAMVAREEISAIHRRYPELAAFTEEPPEKPISKISLTTRPPPLNLELDAGSRADDRASGDDRAPGDDRAAAEGSPADAHDRSDASLRASASAFSDAWDDDDDDDSPMVIVLDDEGNEETEESVLQTGRVAVTRRPISGDEPVPFVLVSSEDPTRLNSINLALGSAATVEAVGDALAVLQGLTDARAHLLVIDCARPTVRLETLLALTPELPAKTRIILWGEPSDLARRLTGGADLPANWVCAGAAAAPEDIGAICRVLLS